MHKAIEKNRERQRKIINFLKSNEKVFLRDDLAEHFGGFAVYDRLGFT